MRRVLLLMIAFLMASVFSWATPRQGSLVLVKATHPPVHRHRAHKATKHHAPKRHRHAV